MRGPNRESADKPFRSDRASICGYCLVCTCDWAYGRPVPGWVTVPSDLHADGYQVISCPEFVPMEDRASDNRLGPENPIPRDFFDDL